MTTTTAPAIRLRFTWNTPTDPAAKAFEITLPNMDAATAHVRLYEGDTRELLIAAEDESGQWRGSARVGAAGPAQFAWA